jgi:predicted nucleic acid-binding protein
MTSKMLNVIADTSCLIVLNKINLLHILRDLYGNVIVTDEVASEYGNVLPQWVRVENVKDKNALKLLNTFLDIGEASSCALALETDDSVVIIDDLKGRRIAGKLGLKITGTLGIVLRAKERNLIDSLKSVVEQIRNEGFYVSEELENEILKYDI